MSKHTPGNWESVGAAICVGEIDIARVYQPNGMDTPQFYANARLIAAAPDLLEALKVAHSVIDPVMGVCPMGWNEASDLIIAAIAKATGE